MTRNMLLLRALALAGAVLVLAPAHAQPRGAAPAAAPAPQLDKVYTPPEALLQQMSEEQARQEIVGMAVPRGFTGLMLAPQQIGLGVRGYMVRGVVIYEDRIEFRNDDSDRPVRSFTFRDMPRPELMHDTVLGMSQYGVPLDKDTAVYFIDGGLSSDTRKTGAMRLADAMFVLRQGRLEDSSFGDKFAEVVAQYRAANPKPQLPEEVRKFRVQAEFAATQKRYVDAVRFYSDGLKLAPWWAQGHFNRALLLAETNRFRDAAGAMARYIQLEPNASDARAAQDKIYQWEAMTQVAPAQGGAARQMAGGGGILAASAVSRPAGDCFVATAAWGSALDPHVQALRRFRETHLLTNAPGRAFVSFYNRNSPPLAHAIAGNDTLRLLARAALTPVVLLVAYPMPSLALTGALAALLVGLLAAARLRRERRRWP